MQNRTKQLIENHIGNDPNKTFDVHSGVPGLHAEVQAVNDVFKQVPNIPTNKVSVATYKVSPSGVGQGGPFEACSNCSGIVKEPIKILTGRKF